MRNKKKRLLSVILLIAMMSTLLAGCGGGSAEKSASTADDKVYGVSYCQSVVGYIYNKTLVKELGIDDFQNLNEKLNSSCRLSQ